MKPFTAVAILSISFMFAFSRDAHAYLDPGSGSFLLQILVAGLIAASFAIKSFFNNLKSLLAKVLPNQKKDARKNSQ